MNPVLRSTLWLAFFGLVLAAWALMYVMAMDMDLDLLGRPGQMGDMMRGMDPRMDMYMPMANFGPLFVMWGAMMAAMMLPTMVPTLRSYEDLMVSADGTRAGWLGVLLGYFTVWLAFAALIAGLQLALLFGGQSTCWASPGRAGLPPRCCWRWGCSSSPGPRKSATASAIPR